MSGNPDQEAPKAFQERIKACLQHEPDAENYYRRLTEFLRKPSDNDEPAVYEAKPETSPTSYPVRFPFDKRSWNSRADRPQVVILEGLPSPRSVRLSADRWQLTPEFFIPHILGNQGPEDLFTLPTLPSRQESMMRIRFSRIVNSLVNVPSLASYTTKRSELEENWRQYEKHLLAGKHYGATRYRDIDKCDSSYYVVDQMVSFTVVRRESSWVAIYLTDEGNSFLNDVSLPWSAFQNVPKLRNGSAIGTVPIVPYNAPVAAIPDVGPASTDINPPLGRVPTSRVSNNATGSNRSSRAPESPSHGKLHPSRNVIVQDGIDMRLLADDPFFLLASLLTTSALSSAQLLNYLSWTVGDGRSVDNDPVDVKLERLRHCVKIVRRIESTITDNLQWIDQGGCSTWPQARPDTFAGERKAALQQSLRRDHQALQRRCANIARDCESAMSFLVGYSQLRCTEQGSAQSAEVNRLTKLATFFLPVSCVTSGFGMGTGEQEKKPPSLSVFVVTAVAVSLVTYAVIFCSPIRRWFRKDWSNTPPMINRSRIKNGLSSEEKGVPGGL